MRDAKPLPRPNAETKPYWDAASKGELLYRHCPACGHAQFPPRDICAACHRPGTEWGKASGRGTVHSFTVVHRAPSAVFKGETPYVVALIDCTEGFRIMTNLRGEGVTAKAGVGRGVRIVFEATHDPAIKLPQAVLEE